MVKRLLQGRMAFLLISATQRGIPFALLPVFVHVLTPTQYGQVGVLTAAFGIGSLTFGFGQELISYRYFFTDDENERDVLRMSALTLVTAPIGFAAVAVVPLLFIRPDIGGTPPEAIAMSVAAAALYVSAWQYAAIELRCTERIGRYFAYALTYTGAVAAMKVVLVVGFHVGVTGWAISDLVGSALLVALTVRISTRTVRRGVATRSGAGIRMALIMGLPIFLSQVASSLAGFSDRIFSVALLSAAAAGGYVVAAQLVTIGNVFMNELGRFLQPRISRRDRPLGPLLREILPRHALFVVAISVAVGAAGQAFVLLGLSSGYPNVAAPAAGLTLLLPFLGFNNVAHDINAIYIGNIRWGSAVAVAMSVTALFSNYVLIQIIGIWGAVVTAVGVQVLTALLLWVPILRYCQREAKRATAGGHPSVLN